MDNDADAGALLVRVRRESGLTQTELARRAGTSQAMVARYETGAASPTVRTLARLLQAAGHSLVLSGPMVEPPGLPSPVATLLREHRAEIEAAAKAVGAENVRIFGSVARGEDTPESDVDLLVDFPANTRGLFPLLRLAGEIEQLLGRSVDVAAVEVMAEPVRERALAEAIPL
jgi:predicted nucleotidyltransferase/DNA-binding XRE family transcriptional regulator